MTEPSALPWSVYRCDSVDEIGIPNQSACGLNGEHFDMSYDECHHPLRLADAELIVKAVNSYPAHLALIERVADIDCLQPWGVPCNQIGDSGETPCESCEARAVLEATK